MQLPPKWGTFPTKAKQFLVVLLISTPAYRREHIAEAYRLSLEVGSGATPLHEHSLDINARNGSQRGEEDDAAQDYLEERMSRRVGLRTQRKSRRSLSLPKSVALAGGIEAWNKKHEDLNFLKEMFSRLCSASNVDYALKEAQAIMSLGHDLWTYGYMRALSNRNADLYYATLISKPAMLLPAVYTPAVGEACQKFGKLPMYSRGCYLSITDKGKFKEALKEYAEENLDKDANGKFLCDVIVFSDGGRILGLGDLGAWGMGIPIGKLDLYTVCAGFNPRRTIPLIIDAGCHGPEENTDHLTIRDHPLYTGLKQERETHKSEQKTMVNSAYYGNDSIIAEFMRSATELFGPHVLLQFEDFNSNDAFPLLAQYRDTYLTYNDDIQGTAAVALAGLLGAMKIRNPNSTNLRAQLLEETFLFHGAGSANLGLMKLLHEEAKVPKSSIFVINSGGLVWRSKNGSTGNFRNSEQKEFAHEGEFGFDTKDLTQVVKQLKPSCVIGAVGVAPGCFTKTMIEALVSVNKKRPVVFALSNPKTQAEITAENAYRWSNGKVIYGSGTWFAPVEIEGRLHAAGQVNNVYIFPGVSFGAVCCQASKIPERFFLAAAEAVAGSLEPEEIRLGMVVPGRDRIQHVALEVATAVVLEAQDMKLANKNLGADYKEVLGKLASMRWTPTLEPGHKF